MTIPGEEARLEAARAEGRKKLRAGIYCRLSLAKYGDTTKVEDQARISRGLAERLGWEIAGDVGHPEKDGVYTDNNKSAWQKNRKRPAWDQMLADVDSGRISAIVVYHGDRLVRRPEDLADLMRLADSKGVHLASPTGTHNLDNQRLELWIRAAFAEEESQRTSERKKSQYERMRRQGLVRSGGRGGRAYGFATDGITHVPAECDHVREMAAMLLAGEPTGALVRDAAARGALTPAGSPFTHGTIRKMLARPRYAGLMPDGENAAAWEPVLERRDWERAREILAAKTATFAYATNARRWLLSGIAVCGACGAPVQIRPSKGRGRREHENGYGCSRAACRKVYRSAPLLDAYVGRMVVNQLNHPLRPDAEAPAAPDSAAEWSALTVERAATEQQVKDYRTSAGRLSLLMARLDAIDARMAELRERESGSTRSRLLETYRGTTWEQWLSLPLEVRRALVAAHFKVTVLPASKRGPGFRTEDVRLEPA